MKKINWITTGLSAFTAAMSTSPPDQWVDPRVIGVAVSTFLLGNLLTLPIRCRSFNTQQILPSEKLATTGERQILLAGYPGSGKTTALRRMMVQPPEQT